MILGLTGAVGAGKSTVAARLAARGIAVLDVDVLAAAAARRAGLNPAQALRDVVDGGPRRAEVERLLVAPVTAEVAAWVAAQRPGPAVLDCAILFEHGLDALCTTTVCLTCPPERRRARVEARSTASAALFDAIERTQLPEAEKARRARHVVDGERALDEVEAEVLGILEPLD